jgi:mannose-6-phosphate isomerase-like protein (cupin superfamily)
MLIRKLDPDQFALAYDVQEQMFFPWENVVSTPFGTGWLVVEPGQRTKPHNHHEHESFFILRGRGRMTFAGESEDVEPGHVIYLPAFGDHILENTSDSEDLHFLTIWWEDPSVVPALKDATLAAKAPAHAEVLLALAATPAVAAAAAVHARYLGLRGTPVRADLGDLGAGAAAALDLLRRLQAAGAVAVTPQGIVFAPSREVRAVRDHYDLVAMPPRLRAAVSAETARGIADVTLAGPAGGGAAVTLAGCEGHRLEPWFERAARLLAAPRGGERPVLFATAEADDARLLAVVLPALAAAAGTAWAPLALIDLGEGAAALPAWAAAGDAPASWNAWLGSLGDTVARDDAGKAPPTQAWTAEQQRFMARLLRYVDEVGAAYEAASFSPRDAARTLGDLVRTATEYAERERPWHGLANRIEERNTAVALELVAAKVLAFLAQPLLPEWSDRLWRALGNRQPLAAGAWEVTPAFVPTGSPVAALAALAAAPAGAVGAAHA